MRVPEHSLKTGIKIFPPDNQNEPIEFASGTLVQVFWSEHNLPKHVMESLEKYRKESPKADYVMCLIGRFWVPLDRKNIRSSQ